MALIYLDNKTLPDQCPDTVCAMSDAELRAAANEYRDHRHHYAAVAAYLLNQGDRMLPEAREFAAEAMRLTASADVISTERTARVAVPDIVEGLRLAVTR